MAKAVLTLDDIKLLLNSEETKNVELYGNLYETLNNLEGIKAMMLEQLPDLDDLGKAAITYNKKTLIDTVVKEWYAERVSEEDPSKKVKCGLCNTPNKYLYYIRNRRNNRMLNVGSHCITKFPGIEGYIEQKKQLSQIHKGHKVVARRNEFYAKFPSCEQVISDAETYFSTLPILLPYDLYTKMQDTITRLRLVYTQYVNEGKKPFKSELDSFELFRLAIKQYNMLKIQADNFTSENKDKVLICKRREINWLISNNKQRLLQNISENGGMYTLSTLGLMSSIDFVKDYESLFVEKNRSNLCKLERINGNSLIFSFNKFGYQPAVLFSVLLNDFMSSIGANCIANVNYTYSSSEIMKVAKIISSRQAVESVINYIYGFVEQFNCAFLIDDATNALMLYRKSDRAIRTFNPNRFLETYSRHILSADDVIKRYVFSLVKGNNTAKWISPEIQAKRGIDEKINRLYKEYRDNHMDIVPYNNGSKRIETIIYNTIYNPMTGKIYIDFDGPEYLSLSRNEINVSNSQLKLINYAIRISDNSIESLYHKGDKLLIQSTQSVRDNNTIFFVSKENGFEINRCHIESEESQSIFKYIRVKKCELQAYGRIVCCVKR